MVLKKSITIQVHCKAIAMNSTKGFDF